MKKLALVRNFTAALGIMVSPGVQSQQQCCTEIYFEPPADITLSYCATEANDRYGGLLGISKLNGGNIYLGKKQLHSFESSEFGCFHDLKLGNQLSLSEGFSQEFGKWILVVFDRQDHLGNDVLSFGDGFIQINRR